MPYYDTRRPKPWPITLMNKIGITNDQTATTIVLVLSGIGILLTVALYAEILNSATLAPEEIDPEVLREMERIISSSN